MLKKIILFLTITLFLTVSGCEMNTDKVYKEIKEVTIKEVSENYIIIDTSSRLFEKTNLYKLELENTSKYEKNTNIYVEIYYMNSKKNDIKSVVILE